MLRLCYVVSLESTLECWDLANGGCLGCWIFPSSARRVAACYGVWTEVTHVKGVQRAKRKKYHMTLRYTQMNEVEGFELLLDLRLDMGFSNSQAMLAV